MHCFYGATCHMAAIDISFMPAPGKSADILEFTAVLCRYFVTLNPLFADSFEYITCIMKCVYWV